MDYFRPPAFPLNRPPLFQPRIEHFNLMHAPGPFHHPSPPPFAMATPSGISIYLQRPPLPGPLHLPMLAGAAPFIHHQHHNIHSQQQQHQQQQQPRDPRKQRHSRRVRQRMKRQPEKQNGEEETKRDTNSEPVVPVASESGYDTTGDCHTPATPLDSPLLASRVTKFATTTTANQTATTKGSSNGLDSRSDSANSINLSETSLKKLLKDLHRCNVSLSKYQAMLDKNCEDGVRNLKDTFNSLRDCLNAREQDLIEKLNSTKESAHCILERRKRTAASLRQTAESDQATLEDGQILELKRQIKCFVTDRKVDEEIGTKTYFQADPDDLLRHIMGFGKVSEARHAEYTVWEENPLEMININKEQILFPPVSDDANLLPQESTVVQLESETKSQPGNSASDSIAAGNPEEDSSALTSVQSLSPDACEDATELLSESSDLPTLPKSPKSPITPPHPPPLANPHPSSSPNGSTSSSLSSPAKSSSKQSAPSSGFNRHTYSYRVSATSSIKCTPKSPSAASSSSIKSGRPWHAVAKFTTKRAPTLNRHREITSSTKVVEAAKNKKVEKDKTEQQKENESGSSLFEKKQEESKKDPEKSNPHRLKYSCSELQTIQSRIKDSLRQQGVYLYDPVTGDCPAQTTSVTGRFSSSSIDTSGERGKSCDQNTVMRKKKTPTQLRRERKKRQKERERRQRELEKKSEAQLKQNAEVKVARDSDASTKETVRVEELKSGDNEQEVSAKPTRSSEADATRDEDKVEGGDIFSSDSELHPKSSRDNSQNHSPVRSTSSVEKGLDDNKPSECQGTDSQQNQLQENLIEHHSDTNQEETAIEEEDSEEEEEEEEEEDAVFSEATSTVDDQLIQQATVNDGDVEEEEKSPSMVILSDQEEERGVTINHKTVPAGHLATKTKLGDVDLTTCEKVDVKADGGMQGGVSEFELELKREE